MKNENLAWFLRRDGELIATKKLPIIYTNLVKNYIERILDLKQRPFYLNKKECKTQTVAATAPIGKMYGVNPFDQPGVEVGKINTYALLGSKEYEERCKAIESYRKVGSKHIV